MDSNHRLPKGSFFPLPRRTTSLRAPDAPKPSPLLRRTSTTYNNLTAAFRNRAQSAVSDKEALLAEPASPAPTSPQSSGTNSSFDERHAFDGDALSPRLASLRRGVLPEEFPSPPGRAGATNEWALPVRTTTMRRAGVPGRLLIPASESPSRENSARARSTPRSSSLRNNLDHQGNSPPSMESSSTNQPPRTPFTPRSSSLRSNFLSEEALLPTSARSVHGVFTPRSSPRRRDGFDESRAITPSTGKSGNSQFLPRKSSLKSLPSTSRRTEPWSQHFSATQSPRKTPGLPGTITEDVSLPLIEVSGEETFSPFETSWFRGNGQPQETLADRNSNADTFVTARESPSKDDNWPLQTPISSSKPPYSSTEEKSLSNHSPPSTVAFPIIDKAFFANELEALPPGLDRLCIRDRHARGHQEQIVVLPRERVLWLKQSLADVLTFLEKMKVVCKDDWTAWNNVHTFQHNYVDVWIDLVRVFEWSVLDTGRRKKKSEDAAQEAVERYEVGAKYVKEFAALCAAQATGDRKWLLLVLDCGEKKTPGTQVKKKKSKPMIKREDDELQLRALREYGLL